jgi:hypothetical protein
VRHRKRRRIVREVDEDQPLDFLHVDGIQSEFRLVQLRLHAAPADQTAIRGIRPLMVRADQPRGVSARFGANDGAAMPTHVVQGMDGAILTTDDDDRVGIHLDEEVIARLRNLTRMPGEQPSATPDLLDVEAVQFGIGKELAGNDQPDFRLSIRFWSRLEPARTVGMDLSAVID